MPTPHDDRLIATYRVAAPFDEARARAEALAAEQSVEMPLSAIRDARVLRDIVARVDAVRPVDGGFEADIALAVASTGDEASQLVNMLFGNCSLQSDVQLVGVGLPAGFARCFPGPRFGIAGIRSLVGAPRRALTCSALKPQGSTVAELARLAHLLALAGIDVVKDDHGLADQAFSPFAERVPAVQRAIAAANRESGGRTVYAPTFSGRPRQLREQRRVAEQAGVRMALVAPMLIGLPSFVEFREETALPLLAHPALGGAARIAPAVLLGTLFRLFGADATIFPNHGGRFSYSPQTCQSLCQAARGPLDSLAPTLPVPAGGMTVDRVEEMLAGYGVDTMLLIGGALLAAGDALAARAREFVARVHSFGSYR
jgi:ribulose-bisphosphate carboxylase large chain